MARPAIRSCLGLLALVLAVSAGSAWWRQHHARSQAEVVGPPLAAAALAGDIQMLSSVSCVFCQRARQWMTAQRVSFSECFIEQDADCAARYRALMAPGTPVLLVRGQAQIGFDPKQVLHRLQAAP